MRKITVTSRFVDEILLLNSVLECYLRQSIDLQLWNALICEALRL